MLLKVRSARPSAAAPADEGDDAQALREGNRERSIAVLSREEGLSAGLVSHVIPLLAGPLSDYAVFALRKVAEERVGQLTDALLDPSVDYKIRRQIARAFSVCVSQRAADALILALDDERFDVRFQSARSVAAIRDRNPQIRIDRERILDVVLRETAVGRPVWKSRRLLDDGGYRESPLDEFVHDRAGQSLAHVFTLLSLVLPRQPLKIAFRSLHSENSRLRGPPSSISKACCPKVRDRLWPFLVAGRTTAPSQPHGEVMANLLRSSSSVTLSRRRTGALTAL